MESLIQSIFLGVVQGLSEFLPISSSGHLIVVPEIFNWTGVVDTLEFDVALHVGTTIAVIWFFWNDWIVIFRSFFQGVKGKNLTGNFQSKLLLLILFGSIPAALVGTLFKDQIETYTREPLLVATALIIFAIVLYVADRFGSKKKSFEKFSWKDAIIVGIAQAVSLVPGTSRSGITITAGLFLGFSREAATRFSFMLSTPAIFGAAVLTGKDALETMNDGNWILMISGTAAAAISGWIAIRFLLKYVANHSFIVFVWYRLVLAAILLLLYW